MGRCSGNGGLFPSEGYTRVWVELEKLALVVVGMFGSSVDGMECVVVLPAASLTTGAKVKLHSVALPSKTWTL